MMKTELSYQQGRLDMEMMFLKHRRIGKTIKKISIAAGIMLVLFTGAGVAYVYFSGKADEKKPAATEEKPAEPAEAPKPAAVDPNGPVGASVVFITSPVHAGENVSMNVH